MSKVRWFQFLIVLVFVAVGLLTAQSAAATNDLLRGSTPAACARPAVSAGTIRAEWDEQRGMMVLRSNAGPTGVDGGLLAILGQARTCSE